MDWSIIGPNHHHPPKAIPAAVSARAGFTEGGEGAGEQVGALERLRQRLQQQGPKTCWMGGREKGREGRVGGRRGVKGRKEMERKKGRRDEGRENSRRLAGGLALRLARSRCFFSFGRRAAMPILIYKCCFVCDFLRRVALPFSSACCYNKTFVRVLPRALHRAPLSPQSINHPRPAACQATSERPPSWTKSTVRRR